MLREALHHARRTFISDVLPKQKRFMEQEHAKKLRMTLDDARKLIHRGTKGAAHFVEQHFFDASVYANRLGCMFLMFKFFDEVRHGLGGGVEG